MLLKLFYFLSYRFHVAMRLFTNRTQKTFEHTHGKVCPEKMYAALMPKANFEP